MKILILDNGTSYLDKLKDWLAGHELTVARIDEEFDLNVFDVIVLTGGHGHGIVNHEDLYKKELDLVRIAPITIIGICLGFEIIAYAFRSTLKQMTEKETGMVDIQYINMPFPNLKIDREYESHRWAVTELGPSLVAVAKSKNGIEILMHRTLPLIGLQFHPEITGSPKIEELLDLWG